MNTTKYLANLALIPFYFTLVLVVNMKDALVNAALETYDALQETKQKYGQ